MVFLFLKLVTYGLLLGLWGKGVRLGLFSIAFLYICRNFISQKEASVVCSIQLFAN